jgi:hypothetical protein
MPATVDQPISARPFCAAMRSTSVAGKARSYKPARPESRMKPHV